MNAKTIDLIPRYAPGTITLPNGYTARVAVEHDADMREPWKEHDGHGPVSEWRDKESKRPGERVLITDHGKARFYDFAEAVKIAKRDGWGSENDKGLSKGAKAARAAEADFKHLQGWCNDEWHWACVDVRLFNPGGAEAAREMCCGIESYGDYWRTLAAELLDQCLGQEKENIRRAALARCFC